MCVDNIMPLRSGNCYQRGSFGGNESDVGGKGSLVWVLGCWLVWFDVLGRGI